jgi:hypothetical protein
MKQQEMYIHVSLDSHEDLFLESGTKGLLQNVHAFKIGTNFLRIKWETILKSRE